MKLPKNYDQFKEFACHLQHLLKNYFFKIEVDASYQSVLDSWLICIITIFEDGSKFSTPLMVRDVSLIDELIDNEQLLNLFIRGVIHSVDESKNETT